MLPGDGLGSPFTNFVSEEPLCCAVRRDALERRLGAALWSGALERRGAHMYRFCNSIQHPLDPAGPAGLHGELSLHNMHNQREELRSSEMVGLGEARRGGQRGGIDPMALCGVRA